MAKFSLPILLFALFALFVDGTFAGWHGHHGHHNNRNERNHPEQNEQQHGGGGGGCAGGGCGRGNWMMHGGGAGCAADGVPLFLFPDHVRRAVDLVLRSEAVHHQDNDELARHLYHMLTHQFPRKLFIVGISTFSTSAASSAPQIWTSADDVDVLNGTVPLPPSPGYASFPFFDGARRFRRENGTKIWFFVYATDPSSLKASAEGAEQDSEASLAKCVPRNRRCVPDNLAELCADRPLAFIAQFGTASDAAIYAPPALTDNRARMALANALRRCATGGEGDNAGDEDEGEERHHILIVAKPSE